MSEGVPLVIPEVNPDALKGVTAGKGGIVANPNCSTIIALMAVTPLHRLAGVKRMVVSTYQVRSYQAQVGSKNQEFSPWNNRRTEALLAARDAWSRSSSLID